MLNFSLKVLIKIGSFMLVSTVPTFISIFEEYFKSD